jgi:hypothetical protein
MAPAKFTHIGDHDACDVLNKSAPKGAARKAKKRKKTKAKVAKSKNKSRKRRKAKR